MGARGNIAKRGSKQGTNRANFLEKSQQNTPAPTQLEPKKVQKRDLSKRKKKGPLGGYISSQIGKTVGRRFVDE